jgi:hypothetical protein
MVPINVNLLVTLTLLASAKITDVREAMSSFETESLSGGGDTSASRHHSDFFHSASHSDNK